MATPSIRGFGRGGSSSTAAPAPPPSLARALWQRRVPLLITHASLGGLDDDDDDDDYSGRGRGAGDKKGAAKKMPPFYATSVPRFGYLAQLLPRLSAFFGRPCSSFHFEDVPLRNLPVGLLMDLYRPVGALQLQQQQQQAYDGVASPTTTTPWRLVVGDGEAWHLGDTFLNGAKEADYVRYGSAKQILGLSKANTEALWHSVQDSTFSSDQ